MDRGYLGLQVPVWGLIGLKVMKDDSEFWVWRYLGFRVAQNTGLGLKAEGY